jgi:hypothetical protein
VRKKPPLTLVSEGGPTGLQPPKPLGDAGRSLWNRVQAEFEISDCGGIELLWQACTAADRAAALAARINEDGEVIRTKTGLREHPCLRAELATRAFIVRTIQRLGINLEAVKPMGRPPAGIGWKGHG